MCWACGLDITKESYEHFSKCALSDMHEEVAVNDNFYNDEGVSYVMRLPVARRKEKNPVILFLLSLLSWRLNYQNRTSLIKIFCTVCYWWHGCQFSLKPQGQFQQILAQSTLGLSFSLNLGPSYLLVGENWDKQKIGWGMFKYPVISNRTFKINKRFKFV